MKRSMDELVATAANPWWIEDALRWEGGVPGSPPLAGDLDVDVVIIGGGYTGMWTAWHLKRESPGLRVALLERDRCGLGPSGRNGGFVHGYWGQLGQLRDLFGADGALEVARAADEAQRGILAFCDQAEPDLWLNQAGIAMVSATPEQDLAVEQSVAVARELGVSEEVTAVDGADARGLCASRRFRKGVFYRHGATVQPARLGRMLRRRVIDAGVDVHEESAVDAIRELDGRVEVQTARGRVTAGRAIVTTGASHLQRSGAESRTVNFSSHMIITEPVPDVLDELGWRDGPGIFDARMFVHYLRTTPDGRIAIGSGSGHIAYGGRLPARLYADREAIDRARRGLEFLIPELKGVRVEGAWGGPIDVSGDGLPFFRRSKAGRILRAGGFSGHGVNPSYLIGRILTSLTAERDDEWARLPLVTRKVPRFPPEPFRWAGGNAIRASIARVEDSHQGDVSVNVAQRFVAGLPKLLNMKIGTR
ncbi:NAD(P)/FAD-dependent oxidoreductase [Nonomuraea sp. LPB2021202275-12-8]|uniref:NAD(P)/FAD-dependent oxidoreductase n=1 Tax=Nonomuraea sp. LPB2021202275-12-8 TaxID=3120159 RepID=UPI00300CA817